MTKSVAIITIVLLFMLLSGCLRVDKTDELNLHGTWIGYMDPVKGDPLPIEFEISRLKKGGFDGSVIIESTTVDPPNGIYVSSLIGQSLALEVLLDEENLEFRVYELSNPEIPEYWDIVFTGILVEDEMIGDFTWKRLGEDDEFLGETFGNWFAVRN